MQPTHSTLTQHTLLLKIR